MCQVISMPHRQDDTARRAFVLTIGASTAVGLREGMSMHGIRQMLPFVNSVIMAGVLVSKNTPGRTAADPGFVKVFDEEAESIFAMLRKGAFSDFVARVGQHRIGEVIEADLDQQIIGALSAEGIVGEVGEEHGLTVRERIILVVQTILMATVAGIEDDALDEAFEEVRRTVHEKAEAWDRMMPADAEWMDDDF